jgi:tetratricopeptide (TPR) repeat protein
MEVNRNVDRGIDLAKEGLYTEALKIFDENLGFTQNPVAMSYYAVSLATAEGYYDKAISLCLMAAEKEFYNPEIYLNLGRIFLLNGQKSVAFKAFRKGLRFDNSHTGIIGEVRRLGIRRRPVLSFLSRGNTVNRLLGMLIVRFA